MKLVNKIAEFVIAERYYIVTDCCANRRDWGDEDEVSLLPSCVSHTLTQVEKESAEPTLVHSDKVKVKHGLIVIADDEDPKGLKVSYRRQGLRKSLSLSNKLLRFEEI